jgi:hypothetical protein
MALLRDISIFKGMLSTEQIYLHRFEPVISLLESRTTTLDFLTGDSLNGFMLTISCTQDTNDCKYKNLSGEIYSHLIAKLVVLVPVDYRNVDLKPPFKDPKTSKLITKRTLRDDSFIEEARKQQEMNLSCNYNKFTEYLPGVAAFSLFDNNRSKDMLALLGRKGRGNDSVEKTVDYLLDRIKEHRKFHLGILVMPMIENSVTFYRYKKKINQDINSANTPKEKKEKEEERDTIYSYLISNTVRLLIKEKVIHMDPHHENFLVKTTDPVSVTTIDFGRISDLIDEKDDFFFYASRQDTVNLLGKYFTTLSKIELLEKAKEFEEEFFQIKTYHPEGSTHTKANFMKKVFLWIQKNTSLGLKRYLDDDYFIPDINNSPMNSWFNEIIHLPNLEQHQIFYDAFMNLDKETNTKNPPNKNAKNLTLNLVNKQYGPSGQIFLVPENRSLLFDETPLNNTIATGSGTITSAVNGNASAVNFDTSNSSSRPRSPLASTINSGSSYGSSLNYSPSLSSASVSNSSRSSLNYSPSDVSNSLPSSIASSVTNNLSSSIPNSGASNNSTKRSTSRGSANRLNSVKEVYDEPNNIGKNPPKTDFVTMRSALIAFLIAGCLYVASSYNYDEFSGGGDGDGNETIENVEEFIKNNDLAKILIYIKERNVCPINTPSTQKEALQKLFEMLQKLPKDADIKLSYVPEELSPLQEELSSEPEIAITESPGEEDVIIESPVPELAIEEGGRRKRRRSRKKRTKKKRKTRTKKQRKTKRR